MTQNSDISPDKLDLMILRELETDGRQSMSDLSKKLGISRAYAGKKLQRLLAQQITQIATFTNPLALGYQTSAIMGIQVSPKEVHATADKLRALANVHLVTIVAGRYDIIIMILLQSPGDLPVFLQRELGTIPSITSVETNIVVETRKVSFSYLESSHLGAGIGWREDNTTSIHRGGQDSEVGIEELDLMILRELEADGRQSVSDLARKLGISRAHASVRLQRLLDQQVAKIVAFNNPLLLGYSTFAMIGIKVSPNELRVAADKINALKDAYWVALVAGTYDIIIWTMFPTPMDLSRFLGRELGSISGITSVEIMIGLELRKTSLHRLVSSYLKDRDNR
jgi:Lrp/AsnC family transcriptional regulator for asnA, asnC and gidA